LTSKESTTFLRAERKTGGRRSYKVIEAEPLETSFGKDIYKKIFEPDTIVIAGEE